MNILITGGAGFIGSHLLAHFVQTYPQHVIVCLDALTYAGNVDNISPLFTHDNFRLVVEDITNFDKMCLLMEQYNIDGVIHLAAESHVDRSITNPFKFAETNVLGTLNLLEAFRRNNKKRSANGRFYQVSTDEVYGSLHEGDEPFTERTPYAPRSPYSAAKASADHFVRAYHETYGIDVVLSNCSNNFGPKQFPEKLIPLFIQNIVAGKPLPIYGKGENIRDWLYVQNHIEAIEKIFFEGRNGETYNVGGGNEWRNIDIIKLLIRIVDNKLNRPQGASEHLITFVDDRLGHDHRYAIDAQKLTNELGWVPRYSFREALEKTVDWYLQNQVWLHRIETGEYVTENKRIASIYNLNM